jgi:hypothetical protein
MLIRNTLIVGAASFALAIACFAGVAAIAGPEIMKNGWTLPFDQDSDTIVIRENGKVVRTSYRTTNHYGVLRGGPAAAAIDRTFPWSGGDSLTVDLPIDVVFVQGDEAKVVASGPRTVLDRLRVEGGHIRMADGDYTDHGALTIDGHGLRVESDSDRVKITVIAPNVRHFEVQGSGDLEIRRLEAPDVELTLTGSGDVEAKGKVETVRLNSSGSGHAELADLKAGDATLDLSGSGDATLFATGKAKIAISGSGDVELRTEPKSVSSEINGSGEVRRDY